MRIMLRTKWAPLLLAPSILAGTLLAHDFYILPDAFSVKPGSKVRIAFHNGDAFPESEGAPILARLKDAQLLSATFTVAVQGVEVSGKRAIGTVDIPQHAGSLLLSAHTIPNFISLASDKFLDYLKEEGLKDVISWRDQHGESSKASRERYSKFAKSIVTSGAADDFYKEPVGFPIEIMAEANPATLRAGSHLPVRVMFQGKPASGLQLEAAWARNGKSKTAVIGRTDADGRIRILLEQAGKWRLHSLLMERCKEPAAADWESYWASLTFEIL